MMQPVIASRLCLLATRSHRPKESANWRYISMEESPIEQSSYYPDPNSIEELFRLVSQDTYINQRLRYSQPKENTLLPPSFIPGPGVKILDLGCGPGGWVLEAAQIFPMCRVIGID